MPNSIEQELSRVNHHAGGEKGLLPLSAKYDSIFDLFWRNEHHAAFGKRLSVRRCAPSLPAASPTAGVSGTTSSFQKIKRRIDCVLELGAG